LQNVVQRAVILCDGETFSIEKAWIEPEIGRTPKPPIPLSSALVNQEREMIEAALEESRGRISGPTGAAGKLGMPRRHSSRKSKACESSSTGLRARRIWPKGNQVTPKQGWCTPDTRRLPLFLVLSPAITNPLYRFKRLLVPTKACRSRS
jgi:hypothetical protein